MVETPVKKTSLGWLALLVISLVAIVYQSTDNSDELLAGKSEHPAKPVTAALFAWSADQVSTIHVSHAEGKVLVLKRSALQEWTADQKVDAGLWKNFDVNVFLGTLSRAKEERQYGKPEDGSKYGFVNSVVVRLSGIDDSHPVAEISIGDLAPDGLSRYVFVKGKEQIVSIPNYHVKEMLRLYSSIAS